MEKITIQLAKDKAAKLLKFFTEKQVEIFESVKVKDSDTLVEYSELVVGADVSVSSSTGSMPAPDGKHILVNGAEFTTKDGKIESIEKEADAPVEDKPEDVIVEGLAEGDNAEDKEVITEDKPAEPVKSEDVKILEEKVSQLEELVKNIMEVIALVPSKEDVEQFNSNVKELSKIPTQFSANSNVDIKESENDKYKKIAEMYSKK